MRGQRVYVYLRPPLLYRFIELKLVMNYLHSHTLSYAGHLFILRINIVGRFFQFIKRWLEEVCCSISDLL